MGLFGFLVTSAGAWIPSPWLDEAATAHIVRYPVTDMLQLWQHIDAIFGPYYLLIHFLVKFTGITPLWLRLPSMVAVGVGTTAMALTGRAVAGGKGQLLFALCFALLPRVTSMGIEARPYAISAAFTALALLAVVKLQRVESRWYWVLLGSSMVGAVAAHLFSALPIMGLVLAAIFTSPVRLRVSLFLTAAAAALVCLPLVFIGIAQKSQVAWIASAPFNIPDQALVEAWFPSSLDPRSDVFLASVSLILSIVAALTIGLALLFGLRPLPKTRLVLAAVPPLVAVAVLWIVSLISEPTVLARYFTSSTPFFAMLVAECIMLLRPYVKQLVALFLAVGCIILVVSERQPYAKTPIDDYAFIASSIHHRAHAGDGFLIEPSTVPTDTARSAVDVYPQDFAQLVDIAEPHGVPLDYPISVDTPVIDLEARATLPSRIWLVTEIHQDSKYAAQLSGLGFKLIVSSDGPTHAVALWTRSRQ